jgi:uncharacterized SAM-binding protein YcdF (DUF218 family)
MYHVLVALLQPFVFLYLVTALALFKLWRRQREQPRTCLILIACFCFLYFCSTPLVSALALGSLEWPYPLPPRRPEDTQAIVILAGYVSPADGARRHPQLGPDTIYRCLEGAELYHQGQPCPVLVSGGKLEDAGPTCAPLMRDFLVKLGVPAKDILVEDQSRSTWENAVESHQLLKPHDISKILLVTDAAHLMRAERCFRRQGMEVVPWGCRYRAKVSPLKVGHFVPSPTGGAGLREASHEWLGLAWYWLHDRI